MKAETKNGAWIALYVKVLSSETFNKLTCAERSVFVQCLLLAARKERDFQYQGHVYHLMPGQLVISLRDLASQCGNGCSLKIVRTAIKKLVTSQTLSYSRAQYGAQSGAQSPSLLTFINWRVYQRPLKERTQTRAQSWAELGHNDTSQDSINGGQNDPLHSSNTVYTQTRYKDCADEEKAGASPLHNQVGSIEEQKPKTIKATTSEPYLLASWFYSSRGVPAQPTPADMRFFKLLLAFYSMPVIKSGIEWRLRHDPDWYWQTHITAASVYRNFGNWMAESSVKALSLKQWVEKNPDMDFDRFDDPLARADAFMRAFNEAKKNRLVYFEQRDYDMYKQAIRIKTREAQNEMLQAKK